MGTKIEMVSISQPALRLIPGNSINLEVRAAKECLEAAGVNPCELGVLINTGVYRSKNLGEPAIATLIQNRLGSNPTPDYNNRNSRSTFSFDLNNGGCGWLTGIQIIHDIINNGDILYGMVVTGDSEPFFGLSKGFHFKSAGAAIILSKSLDSRGFLFFRSYSYPDYSDELVCSTDFTREKWDWRRRNILYIREKETYLDFCVKCASESLKCFFSESGIKPGEISLIIPSQSPDGFITKMKKLTGMNNHFIEVSHSHHKELHTAGPAFAYKSALNDKRFYTSKYILFLTVGSGISVSIALYIN